MVNPVKKCCGTCVNWRRHQDPPSCHWVGPALPFWASINNGDHDDYTEFEDGKNCRVWEQEFDA